MAHHSFLMFKYVFHVIICLHDDLILLQNIRLTNINDFFNGDYRDFNFKFYLFFLLKVCLRKGLNHPGHLSTFLFF